MDPVVFQQLVVAVAVAIVSLVAFAFRGLVSVGITYLQNKVGQSGYEMIQGFVKTVVSFFEQSPVFKDLMGEEKKQRVILEVVKFCQDHNLPIDHELIDKLIEEAVLQVKKDLNLVVG
jgi:hypothetical protein